ncbi:uncharacterized protein LOC126776473 isoform X2 [Nymphalis io]|uniref:uncharacterized protein LOC126776473 isoform X2 n=1 Tax=Inachis io TaxID=171585 RepID=UPI0021685C29|nr:uncharacterized protein LOC126776473 isoform X2 [Nymphalis io]
MQGGFVGGICFLACLLSLGVKSQNVLSSQDQFDATNGAEQASQWDAQGELDARSSAYASPSVSPASALASAKAGDYGTKESPYNYPYVDPNSALAKALAGGVIPYGTENFKSADPQAENIENDELVSHSFDYMKAGPESLSQTAANNEQLGLLSSGTQSNTQLLSKEDNIPRSAQEEDEGLTSKWGGYDAGLFTGAVSRVITQDNFIIPNTIPGGENIIACTEENQIHTLWTPVLQCLVCVCVREGWYLKAVCVSCNKCDEPLPPMPVPPPQPFIPTPPPRPDSQASCAPLPENVPFQNPLNPCQICICKRSFNVFGQPDVLIQCEENPQCIPPQPDVIPIPPPPVPPQPLPLSPCERYPLDTLFPHPLEACVICKCVLEAKPFSPPEKDLVCMPDPQCNMPDIIPLPPLPNPSPAPMPQPQPFIPPDIEPIPWPPIVPNKPKPPSPLPGPPPHESCRPYPPDQPFQHPWDECQICVCSEIYGPNVINIEVNCYTKPSCCIEPPITDPNALPFNSGSQVMTLDPMCEYQSLSVDFTHPKDVCKICHCEMFTNMIVPICRPTKDPGCIPNAHRDIIYLEPRCRYRAPHETFVIDCQVCSCQAVFQYVISRCNPIPNCGAPYYPSIGSEGNADAFAQSIALSNSMGSQAYSDALASSLSQTGPANPPQLINPSLSSLPYPPDSLSTAQAQAAAMANTQSGGLYGNYHMYPGSSSQSIAQAQAEASANTQSDWVSPFGQLTVLPGTSGESNAQAQAEAIANAQNSGLNGLYDNFPYNFGSNSQSNAQAQALANAQASGLSPYGISPYSFGGNNQATAEAQAAANAIQLLGLSPASNIFPYTASGPSQSSAQAQAEAIANSQGSQSFTQAQAEALANAQTNNYGQYPSLPYLPSSNQANAEANAFAASQLNPSLYGFPGSGANNLYQPALQGWDSSSQALANAQSVAQAQNSATAQSLAQESILSGRPLIKSGPGLCQYDGDKYHHNCQACYCFSDNTGGLYTLCLGNSCV